MVVKGLLEQESGPEERLRDTEGYDGPAIEWFSRDKSSELIVMGRKETEHGQCYQYRTSSHGS